MSNKNVRGPIDRVPCPHCGKPNDFREMKAQHLLDTGHRMFCDHCGHSMEVVQILAVEYVAVRRDPNGGSAAVGGGRRAAAAAPQRKQVQPGFIQRLLGKG